MSNPVVNNIEQIIKDSINWNSNNSESMDFHRVEGVLSNAVFKKHLLKDSHDYDKEMQGLLNGYYCGFEIEFFLQPHKISLLEKDIAEILPDYQMLLISLDEVPKTNCRNFYLIKETTGEPPKGMSSYEIVSPKLDYKSLPYFILKFFNILTQHGANDNDSIGFHLHVSTLKKVKISPISLIYYLHQLGVLDAKERKYTRDIVNQFFSFSSENWQWLFEEVTRKCYNVNFLHYQDNNHIELRSMGGLGYLNHADDIIIQCLNCLLAYEKALKTPSNQIAEEIVKKYSLKKQIVKTKNLEYENLKQDDENDVWIV